DAPVRFPNGSIGTLENGLLGIPLATDQVAAGGVSFTGEDFNKKTPYTQAYNLTLQYQLAANDSLQAGYVGNTVRHLGVYINPNSPAEILPTALNFFIFSISSP